LSRQAFRRDVIRFRNVTVRSPGYRKQLRVTETFGDATSRQPVTFELIDCRRGDEVLIEAHLRRLSVAVLAPTHKCD
jgi:hypothetical protein